MDDKNSTCDSCNNKGPLMCDHILCLQDGICEHFTRKNVLPSIGRKDRKWDKGKLKFTLILPEFHALMAEILTKGEVNHPKEPDGTPSWQLVEPEAYENAIERHFNKYRRGEIVDTDPNMPTDHMGNIAVNAMFLWWFNQQKKRKKK